MSRKLAARVTLGALLSTLTGLSISACSIDGSGSSQTAGGSAGTTSSAGTAVQSSSGSAMASDAFLPFADGLDAAIEAGATAVIQPGGGMRDAEVVARADEAGIAMVFTGMRHFRH